MDEYRYAGYIKRAQAIELLGNYDFLMDNSFWQDCRLDDKFQMYITSDKKHIQLVNLCGYVSCLLDRKNP